jgi:hypothetical protein
MGYSNQPFNKRFEKLGDAAEAAFERWAPTKNIRYEHFGLKRPRVFVPKLSMHVRSMPDFVCQGGKGTSFFVECKGTGGRVVKIKLETMEHVARWNDEHTVWFFIYDSNNDLAAFVNYRQLETLCHARPIKKFDDGKAYYTIPASVFTWEDVPKEQSNGNEEEGNNGERLGY